MRSGARAMPVSWTRSAIPGALRTPSRRRGERHYKTSSPRTRGPITPGLCRCKRRLPQCQNEKPRCMGPRFRGDDDGPLITARGIDDVLKPLAGFEAFDLARHVFRYFVGIGIGCVVRRQDDFWMRPEWAVRRKRFRCEDIKRSRAERAVVKAFQNVGFRLQPASPGIDQDWRAHRAISVEPCEQFAVQNVPRIWRERQQADQDIGSSQKRFELRFAVKARDPVDLPRTPAPARHAKTYTPEHFGRVRPKRAEAHDADRNCARRPLKPRP